LSIWMFTTDGHQLTRIGTTISRQLVSTVFVRSLAVNGSSNHSLPVTLCFLVCFAEDSSECSHPS